LGCAKQKNVKSAGIKRTRFMVENLQNNRE